MFVRCPTCCLHVASSSTWWLSEGFLRLLLKYIFLLHHIAFGRIWQHARYSYRVWRSFAYNSDNFQKSVKMEKCKHFVQMFGFGPKQSKRFVLPARAPPRCAQPMISRLYAACVCVSAVVTFVICRGTAYICRYMSLYGSGGGGCPPRNQVKFRLLAAPGQYMVWLESLFGVWH
jgi:hypothetical protein